MIKAIFLDWGKTFSAGHRNVEKELNGVLVPYQLNWSELYPCWKNFYYLRSRGRIRNDAEMFIQIQRVMQKEIPVREIKKILVGSYLVTREHIGIVRRLKKKYKVGLLSNHIEEWLMEFMVARRIDNLFDSIIVSSAVGVTKPDAEIYFLALESLGVKPEEAVFVSDELNDDLVASKGCGMKTIWYLPERHTPKKKKELKIAELFQPDAIIEKFAEIEKIAGGWGNKAKSRQ